MLHQYGWLAGTFILLFFWLSVPLRNKDIAFALFCGVSLVLIIGGICIHNKKRSPQFVIDNDVLIAGAFKIDENRKAHVLNIKQRTNIIYEISFDDSIPIVLDLTPLRKTDRKYVENYLRNNFDERIFS